MFLNSPDPTYGLYHVIGEFFNENLLPFASVNKNNAQKSNAGYYLAVPLVNI
jgi:hypothetical protein